MKRYTNSEIKARLILAIGICLGLTFMMSVGALLYGLLFVVQPLEVSPNDESAWATYRQALRDFPASWTPGPTVTFPVAP